MYCDCVILRWSEHHVRPRNCDEIAWTITWSGDIPIAIIFSKEHAAQAARIAVETDLKSPLFLCVNLPKAAYSTALVSASNSLMRISSRGVYQFSLQTKANKVPAGSGWIHETKHDGYIGRCLGLT
jgi:hypothetical protein